MPASRRTQLPDGVSVKLEIPDFTAQLKRFERTVQKKIAARAVNKGAQVFKVFAKREAPVLAKANKQRIKGLLQRTIIVAKSKFNNKTRIEYTVTVRGPKRIKSAVRRLKAKRRAAGRATDAFYWYFLEHGWAPRRPGQALRGGDRSKRLQRQRNRAAGATYITGKEFLAKAFRSAQSPALLAVIREMNAGIDEESRRVR